MAYTQKLQQVYFQGRKLRRTAPYVKSANCMKECNIFTNLTACNI